MPHHAVCSAVLNLPEQDGFLPDDSALARAYRVITMDNGTRNITVGAKPVMRHH